MTSGYIGNGERAHAWASVLREEVERSAVPIVVPDPGTSHGRELVEALGATYVPMFRNVPESEYHRRANHIRARLRAQGIKDCTPGRDR